MQRLVGKVAVVTGASRGGGRGIAVALGQQGAAVYVTGRSVRGEPTTGGWPGTIEEAAEEITAAGGAGIPVRCDQTKDDEVESLFDQVRREHGKIDILINNAWGGYERADNTFSSAFWKQPIWRWDKMWSAGVRSHLVTTRFAAKLMLRRRKGIIINTTSYFGGNYHGSLFYDVAKNAINRMTYCMAEDLKKHSIPVVALAPGWMRTERMKLKPDDFLKTHSVEFTGRAVVALVTDPKLMEKSGRVVETADVGMEYGFTDVDGRQVPPLRDIFPGLF